MAALCEETGASLITVTLICGDDDKCGLVSKLVQSILWLQGLIITDMNSNYMHRKHGKLSAAWQVVCAINNGTCGSRKSPSIRLPIILLLWAFKLCALFTVNRYNWIIMPQPHLFSVHCRRHCSLVGKKTIIFLPRPPRSFWQWGWEAWPRNGH